MKKLITICLLLAAVFVVKAQNKITGTKGDFPRGVPYFDKVNFEITYQVVEDRGTIRVNLSNPKIFVHSDSKYNYQGKFYSRQDLGLANWPQTQKPINFGVYLSVQYPGGTVNHMFSCTESGICKDNNDYILASNANKNNYKPADFQVSYNGTMTYDGQGNDQVERLIVAKIANANTSSQNPLSTASSTITKTNKQDLSNTAPSYNTNSSTVPKTTSGTSSPLSQKVKVNGQEVQVYQQGSKYYMVNADGTRHETTQQAYNTVQQASNKKIANANNDVQAAAVARVNYETTVQETQRQAYEQAQAAKAAKAELTAELVTQAGSLIGGLLNDWNDASERKAQRRDAERLAAIETSGRERRKKLSDKFEFVYLPLMDLAKKGDENARMILYFSSWRLEQESSVPLRQQWLEEALTNNNIDALLMNAVAALNTYKKGDDNVITNMEKIAETGSVDAMINLASFYNSTGASGVKPGGNDPKKAMEWYKIAADKGSPDAMHSLGMIYKYGRTNNPSSKDRILKKWVVKYDIVLDEKAAFDWFTKSLRPDYVESIYAKFSPFSSKFNEDSYLELADFYKKGKIVPKDEAKARELENLHRNYKYTRAFGYIE